MTISGFKQPQISEYEEIDVFQLLDQVIGQCRSQTGSRTGLQNMAQRDLPRLRCAPDLIKYALQTLTTNAIRAIPDGGDVELSAKLAFGGMVMRVRAHPEDSCPSLAATLTANNGGSNLAVVQQIVHQHGGLVRVEPNTYRGVTISMLLPMECR